MGRSVTFILFFFLCCSCTDALREGINDFKASNAYENTLTDEEIDAIPIEFDDLPAGVLGICTVFSGGADPEITFDQEYWDLLERDENIGTVVHEFGHCAYGRDHRDGTDSNGDYLSIMNSTLSDETKYDERRDYYVEELGTETSEFYQIW